MDISPMQLDISPMQLRNKKIIVSKINQVLKNLKLVPLNKKGEGPAIKIQKYR